MDTAYLNIDKKVLGKTKKMAEETAANELGNDSDLLIYNDLTLKVDEVGFEDGVMSVSASLISNSDHLGYVSLDYTINPYDILPIISYYVKLLGRLKTILEATK